MTKKQMALAAARQKASERRERELLGRVALAARVDHAALYTASYGDEYVLRWKAGLCGIAAMGDLLRTRDLEYFIRIVQAARAEFRRARAYRQGKRPRRAA